MALAWNTVIVYDHPFFGWLLLGGILEIVGYPNTIHSNLDTTVESIEKIYSAPRIVMGFLAILDTFLVYLIVIYRYNNKTIAFFASLFCCNAYDLDYKVFILLDPIEIALLLSSILFALYSNIIRKKHSQKKPFPFPLSLILHLVM